MRLSAASLLVLCLGGAVVTGSVPAWAQPKPARLTVLSSDPRFVAGDDVLVRFTPGPGASQTTFRANGAAARIVRREVASDGEVTALIDGLRPGRNVITAEAGNDRAEVVVQNHSINGPVFPGTEWPLLSCRTEESGLGAPADTNCNAPSRIDYFYRTTAKTFKPLADRTARPTDLAMTTRNDTEVPYIVRVESGVVDRSIYRIAVLDDPTISSPDPKAWRPSPAWNGRLVVFFGGGCGVSYAQGGNHVEAVLSDNELSRGFAYVVSPTLVNQQFCNPLIQGEALMMIKQHFIKAYGPPVWTLGSGASGGSIQQYTIAQMFPGLLDGLQPGASFPDTLLQPASDCHLLSRAYASDAQRWTSEKQAAVNGAPLSTCLDWTLTFGRNMEAVPSAPDLSNPVAAIVATVGGTRIASPYPCDVQDKSRLYGKASNPKGLRCSQYDIQGNLTGRDASGVGLRPFDNVGVQYGLSALNAGKITIDDFISLNESIGGYDRDGGASRERVSGDLKGIHNAYVTGLVNSGGGGLGSVPIITLRNYMDDVPGGHALALHDRLQDFIVRARLIRANGSADNQVIWTAPLRGGVDLNSLSLDLATRWLDAIAADPQPPSLRKVVAHKPADAMDACWSSVGEKLVETATTAPDAKCNQLYPLHSEPRMVAGAGLTGDVQKCQLQPPTRAMYPAEISVEQFAHIRAIFRTGVCDYSRPSAGYAAFGDPFAAVSPGYLSSALGSASK